jgi:hypothetical protein
MRLARQTLLLVSVALLASAFGTPARRAFPGDAPDARSSRLPAGARGPRASVVGQGPDWPAVERALGRKGTAQPGGVYKFSLPRGDLRVTVDGVTLKPSLALGSWVAFAPADSGAVAMGDLVLTEDEVEPVLTRLVRGGVEVSALHNHLLRERPRVLYMHVHATGDPVKTAETIRAAVSLTKTPPAPAPTSSIAPARTGGAAASPPGLDTAAVARTLGLGGRMNGGVYQVSVPRADSVTERGVEIPPAMGVATAINFQPTGGGKAAATGDFVMIASEVNPVIGALREHGIEVTALHGHMLDESPRLFFMHFWGNGDAVALARGLRAALDRMAVRHAVTQ